MKTDNKILVKHDYLTKARLLLYNKYSNNLANNYNKLKINDILTNSRTRLVSLFKDYLLFEDDSEFFKRYYNGKESKQRIKKISKFLHKEIYIYPNYASLEEGKYILSNIIRKQMILNKQKRNKFFSHNNFRKKLFEINNNVFNNAVYDDILGQQKSESFIYSLFGLDNLNNKKSEEQIENNEKEEINKINNIINIIEKNENLYLKQPEKKIIVNTLMFNKNKYKNILKKDLSKSNISIKENENEKEKEKNMINIDNNVNEETKDSSNGNIINPYIKQKSINNKKMIYHRKVKSTLSGNMTKLELSSNSNIIQILKNANETFAQEKKDKKLIKEIFNKTKRDKIEKNSKIEILKLPIEKKEVNCNHSRQNKNNIPKKDLNKLTRNNQGNINNSNNTSILLKNNKSIYVKNKVIKCNMSNKNILSNKKNEYKKENLKRKLNRPYSKPKCIYNKDIKYKQESNKTYYNNHDEIIYIERLK